VTSSAGRARILRAGPALLGVRGAEAGLRGVVAVGGTAGAGRAGGFGLRRAILRARVVGWPWGL